MAFTAPTKPTRTPVEAGPTRGVCYMVADLGTSLNEFDNKMKRQVLIGFELPDILETTKEDGVEVERARTINKFMTLSLNEKATLRLILQAWRGREMTDDEVKNFDLFSIVGKSALLNIVHKTKNGQPKADIGSITGLPRGMTSAVLSRRPIMFAFGDPDHDQFTADIPQWVQNMIMKSDEWKAAHGDVGGMEENVPNNESF